MTPEKAEEIERAIAQIGEAHWSNRNVYEVVGGNYGELAQYLKARRLGGPDRPPDPRSRSQPRPPVETQATLAAMESVEPAPLVEQYRAAVDARAHAEARLATLEEQASREMLSLDQEAEVQLLERRVSRLEPRIAELERRVAHEQAALDVPGVVAAWAHYIPLKEAAYDAIALAITNLYAAFAALMDLHTRQAEVAAQARYRGRRLLAAGDHTELLANIISRMPSALGWDQVLHAQPLTKGDLDLMKDVDPGMREISPYMIQRYLETGGAA